MSEKLNVVKNFISMRYFKKFKTRDKLEKYQNKMLLKQMKYIKENSEYFKNIKADSIENFKDLPLMDKKVMMENFTAKSKSFIPSGKLAIGIKYSKDSMEIVEHLSLIGYVLFHHRSSNGQHLYAVNDVCRVIQSEEVGQDRYKVFQDKSLFIAVDADFSIELDSSSIDSTLKKFTKTTRYDAQFAFINDITI